MILKLPEDFRPYIVRIYLTGGNTDPAQWESGTGTLVEIEGSWFVFTAGHVVDGLKSLTELRFALDAETNGLIESIALDYKAINISRKADAAVVLLSERAKPLWPSARPVAVDDLVAIEDLAKARRLPANSIFMLMGYPHKNQVLSKLEGVNAFQTSTSYFGRITYIMEDSGAPESSKGFKLRWDGATKPELEGISGGPVLIQVPNSNHWKYVGCQIETNGGTGVLCESVASHWKLLLNF